MNTSTNILLLGATGYTGSLVAERFLDAGVDFWAFGRNQEKLVQLKSINSRCKGIETFVIGNVAEQLKLNNSSIVINCIGPFNVYAEKIVDACIAAGCVYFDITGEQEIVKQSFFEKSKFEIRPSNRYFYEKMGEKL